MQKEIDIEEKKSHLVHKTVCSFFTYACEKYLLSTDCIQGTV